MGSGGGLGLAAVLAAAVLCGPGVLAGRVLSGECTAAGGGRGAGPVWKLALAGAGTTEGKNWNKTHSLNGARVGGEP